MGLKHRLERIEEKLDPNREDLMVVFEMHYGSPIKDPKAVKPPDYYIGPWCTACFVGGTEAQQREALKRLRRDPRYQKHPCGERLGRALAGDQEAGTSALATSLDKQEGEA